MKIAIKDLKPNPIWHSEREPVDALADNIKALGGQPIQKPVVRSKDGKYEVICGWRRVLACKKAGAKGIDCELRDMNDTRAGMLLLSENLFRSNLDDVTKAEICKEIYELQYSDSRSTSYQIVKYVRPLIGITESTIYGWLQTLNLPDDIQQQVKTKEIKGEVARKAHKIGGKKMVETAIKKDIGRHKIQKIGRQLSEIEQQYSPEEYEKVKEKVVSGEITEPEKIKKRAEDLHVKKTWDWLAKQFGAPDIYELTEKDIIKNIQRTTAFLQMLLDNKDIREELLTRYDLLRDLNAAIESFNTVSGEVLYKIDTPFQRSEAVKWFKEWGIFVRGFSGAVLTMQFSEYPIEDQQECIKILDRSTGKLQKMRARLSEELCKHQKG